MPQPVGNKPAAKDVRSKGEKSTGTSMMSPAGIREAVESIVIAFVLAFLFRTFEAEAFVIPTGSMAPTLMGRHRDVTCPNCKYEFQVSASDEVDPNGNLRPGVEVIAGTCPMCRFPLDMGRNNPQKETYPSYKGDRILVSKFPYQTHDPKRWDVAVFRYPGSAKINYIKRVVGLPDETVVIQYGDIYIKKSSDPEANIERKPPDKVLAMAQPVYDNDFVAPAMEKKGWPERWQTPPGFTPWVRSEDHKSFSTDGKGDQPAWIAYRHFVPTYDDWRALAGDEQVKIAPRPHLISDFSPYNTELTANGMNGFHFGEESPGLGPRPDPTKLGLHWVGDLIAEFELETQSAAGQILVKLIKGGNEFVCRFQLDSGQVTLAVPGTAELTSNKGIGKGKHRVRLANVDAELTLWIDGRVVEFPGRATYDPDLAKAPSKDDLAPVWIGSQGAVATVRHLRLFRDIYYIAQKAFDRQSGSRGGEELGYGIRLSDFRTDDESYPYKQFSAAAVEEFMTTPSAWGIHARRVKVDFTLEKGQFLMLGDNSAESKDSRLWMIDSSQYYVNRELLIGKAMFIYWPHSWNRIPGTPIPFPMFPNFPRMKFVR